MKIEMKADVPAVFLAGPYCGHEFKVFSIIGKLIGPMGCYLRTDQKDQAGRVIFKWNQFKANQ